MVEKLVERVVAGKPDDVLGNGFDINVTDHRAVELIEHQHFQEYVTDIGVSGKLCSELTECFFG